MADKLTQAPLRVGLLLDSLVKPRWIYKVIADIRSSTTADVALVIEDDSPIKQQSLWRRIWGQRRYWLYRIYSRLDNVLFRLEPDAFERVNLGPLISDCPILRVQPVQRGYADYLRAEDVATIRDHQLDVALRFGFRILRGEALQIAKYGIWSYHHGDNLVNRGGPPGFWEVVEGHPVTGSILQILSEDLDAGKVIYRSYAPTHKRSVKRNKNNYYWKSASFVGRKLADLYEDGPPALDSDPYASAYCPYSQRLYRNPTNQELLPLLLRFGVRTAFGKLEELLSTKRWFLAYCLKPGTAGIADTLYRFKHIVPPKDRYWADPFPVKHRGKYFIFVEEYTYEDGKGRIAVIEMDQEGSYGRPAKVLEKASHLSYPFVFQWRGDYYMIPETAQSRAVELYRCRSFPFEWELETVLMEDVKAVDATLIEVDGRWWMFVNIGVAETANAHDELYLFYAETPLGPWQPHRRNPVKSDCRSARPAGRFFWWRGDLYRPAQDCSRNYGYAIVLNKVSCLTPDRFSESEVSRILPLWSKNLIATHTLNNADGLTVIDGMSNAAKWSRFGRTDD